MDYEQDYLSNKEIDIEYKFKPFDLEAADECPIVVAIETDDGKSEVVRTYTKYGYAVDEYDDDLFNNKVFHRRIKHVRTQLSFIKVICF